MTPPPSSPSAADVAAIHIRVLIVDDDDAHAHTVAESLERMGTYECTVATTGQRGAELIASDSFDVIITDLRMADVDGLAIIRTAQEKLPDAKVIQITGHATIKSTVTAMQMGAATVLTKP